MRALSPDGQGGKAGRHLELLVVDGGREVEDEEQGAALGDDELLLVIALAHDLMRRAREVVDLVELVELAVEGVQLRVAQVLCKQHALCFNTSRKPSLLFILSNTLCSAVTVEPS